MAGRALARAGLRGGGVGGVGLGAQKGVHLEERRFATDDRDRRGVGIVPPAIATRRGPGVEQGGERTGPDASGRRPAVGQGSGEVGREASARGGRGAVEPDGEPCGSLDSGGEERIAELALQRERHAVAGDQLRRQPVAGGGGDFRQPKPRPRGRAQLRIPRTLPLGLELREITGDARRMLLGFLGLGDAGTAGQPGRGQGRKDGQSSVESCWR